MDFETIKQRTLKPHGMDFETIEQRTLKPHGTWSIWYYNMFQNALKTIASSALRVLDYQLPEIYDLVLHGN